jgi:hypothetical protein
MKKLLILILLLLPTFVFGAGLTLPQGGLGTTTVPNNYVLIGSTSPLRVNAVATSSLGLPTFADLHSPVTLSGAYDYITLVGQDIVRGLIDLTTDVTGTLPVSNGGTGSTTLSGILKGNGTSMIQTAVPDTDYQVPLTFGDGLTRTVNDVDCDTASGSIFGCLLSADWTTFNNKENALTFNYPLSRSTNTISFDGLSTTTPWTAGDLAQVTNGNTINSVATSSLGLPTFADIIPDFWSVVTNFGVPTVSTTTPVWIQSNLYASTSADIRGTNWATTTIGKAGDYLQIGCFPFVGLCVPTLTSFIGGVENFLGVDNGLVLKGANAFSNPIFYFSSSDALTQGAMVYDAGVDKLTIGDVNPFSGGVYVVDTLNVQGLGDNTNSVGTDGQVMTSQSGLSLWADFVESPWEIFNGMGIRPIDVTSKVLIGATATTTEAQLEVASSTAVVGSGASLVTDIWDVLNLGMFYAPRLTPTTVGGLGEFLFLDGNPILMETSGSSLCNSGSTNPCQIFMDDSLGASSYIEWDYGNVDLKFGGASRYSFDAGIKPTGIIDNTDSYGSIGWILTNVDGLNLGWADPASLASKWTEFNQASRDTLVPAVSLGVSRVAIGPTNLITSADTALNVSGGSINVASSTLLMLNEVPFLTNCDSDVHDITSYSVCLGGSAGSITTGIYNFMAGLGAGASLDNDDYNILIGAYTGTSLTTAQDNTSIGFQSMFSATDALENISIGSNAMYYTETPNYNVAIGHLAMTNATTSSSTVAIGYSAGTGAFQYGGLIGGPTSHANTYVGAYSGAEAQANPIGNTFLGYYSGKINTGDYNTYLGTNAGAGMFSSNYNNVAVGINAMFGGTSVGAGNNTALGDSALFSITSGDSNVAVGEDACYSMTTGGSNFCLGEASAYSGINVFENTSIGTSALFSNITGNENVAIGSSALQRNLSATSSVAVGNEAGQGTGNYYSQGGTYIGYRAGENVATGSDFNTFLGHWAGKVVTTSASSTLLGYLSGSNLTTGNHNLSVGSNIQFPSATANNQMNIANIIFGTDIDGVGSTLSTGKVGIATSTPTYDFTVDGTVGFANVGAIAGSSDALCMNGDQVLRNTGVTTCLLSSKRFKNSIESYDGGLESIMKIEPSLFKYNGKNEVNIGLIAEQLDTVDKRLVEYGEDGLPRSIDQTALIATLVSAVQDQQKQIDELEKKIDGNSQESFIKKIIKMFTNLI